jgi:spore coat protein U-like protein
MLSKMWNARTLIVAGTTVLGLGATSAILAGTEQADLPVSASVAANCTISTSAVAFGAYDPTVANASTPLDQDGSVTVTCTSGASTTITLGEGDNADTGSTPAAPVRRMSDGAGTPHYLAYSLYQDSGRTTVWGDTAGTGVPHTGDGTATTVNVYGRVGAGQNVPTGSYSDTVVATVTF